MKAKDLECHTHLCIYGSEISVSNITFTSPFLRSSCTPFVRVHSTLGLCSLVCAKDLPLVSLQMIT